MLKQLLEMIEEQESEKERVDKCKAAAGFDDEYYRMRTELEEKYPDFMNMVAILFSDLGDAHVFRPFATVAPILPESVREYMFISIEKAVKIFTEGERMKMAEKEKEKEKKNAD